MLSIRINILIVMCFVALTSGVNIVEELRQRFNDMTNECVDAQNNTHPAYMCSGLLIHGCQIKKEMKFPWGLKSQDKKDNALSYAYLRRNHTFERLGDNHTAGFIIYPHLKTPPHKLQRKVLCYFPNDADTHRREDRGCGRHELDKTGLGEPCHTQNITTASQWSDQVAFSDFSSNWPMLICGFKMINERQTEDFAVGLQANTFLQKYQLALYSSELRIEAWDENDAKSIPIEAFFYLIGTENGYQEAVKIRDEFYAQSGEMMPIVGIKLPKYRHPEKNIEITGDETSN